MIMPPVEWKIMTVQTETVDQIQPIQTQLDHLIIIYSHREYPVYGPEITVQIGMMNITGMMVIFLHILPMSLFRQDVHIIRN